MLKLFQKMLLGMEVIPWIGPRLKIMRIFKRLIYLHDSNLIEEARDLRKQVFIKMPPKLHGPLYHSLGEDQLYSLRDYPSAFDSFQKAILLYKKTPILMSGLSPDRLYGGASQAAIQVRRKEEALDYYITFSDIVEGIAERPSLEKYLSWHRNVLKQLKQDLEIES